MPGQQTHLFSQLIVNCDRSTDVGLFRRLQQISPALASIPPSSIQTYPQQSAARKQARYRHLLPLFEYDRPDFILELDGRPILVVEVTEHAYTGDNGLQRFVRAAAAAENAVPFIYFGPISRTRDDEMDRLDDDADVNTLSKRSLTSDFFEGMESLHAKFGSSQLFVDWHTAANGKVLKASSRAKPAELKSIYGELVSTIEAVVVDTLMRGRDDQARHLIRQNQREVSRLAAKTNTLSTDVKFSLSAKDTAALLRSPSTIGNYFDGYFAKGKPDKLIAYHALRSVHVSAIRAGKKVEVRPDRIKKILDALATSAQFHNGSIAYYTGYKWRSDPHSGVAANVYYRVCEREAGPTKPLIIFYPRVSVRSEATAELLRSVSFDSALGQLFTDRYGHMAKSKFEKTTASPNLYGTWQTTTKQARIFTKYAAVIVCSDGLVLGSQLTHLLDDV